MAAVKRWLDSHTDWLLILDNVENLEMVREFLPTGGRGHILLTTRAQALGSIAQKIEINKMTSDEGILFLLRRAKIIGLSHLSDKASIADKENAKEIVREMDGLPLAIDQAGAYIESTQCGLSHYLDLYRIRRAELLRQRGEPVFEHPDSVTTTFSLSFGKVQQINPDAVELLQFCAFLHPDAMSEEMITEGSSDLGQRLLSIAKDPLKLDEAIAALLKYSLLRRNSETKTLSIHRLVQAVLKDEMKNGTRQQWSERIVRVVSYGFPNVDFGAWPRCQRYLSHAQVCANYIDEWNFTFPEAAQLLTRMGNYLLARGQYDGVEHFFIKALSIREHTLGPTHLLVAQALGNLTSLYNIQSRYPEAEVLIKRATDINKRNIGADLQIAMNLHEQAELSRAQGSYSQAEKLFRQAVEIFKNAGDDFHLIHSLNGLADTCRSLGKYSQAERLYLEALDVGKKALNSDNPLNSVSFNNLARLYVDLERYAEAEPLFQQALEIWKRTVGQDHPHVATCLNNIGELYRRQGKISEAVEMAQQALKIFEEKFSLDHPHAATCFSNLSLLSGASGKFRPPLAAAQCRVSGAADVGVVAPRHRDVCAHSSRSSLSAPPPRSLSRFRSAVL